MKIIVGLGNPGENYKNTRHNVGFMAIDRLAEKAGGTWETSKKFNSEFIRHGDTLFLKPLTAMNNSGEAVEAALSYYKLLPKKLGLIKEKNSNLAGILTVIHDELDLPLGQCKTSIDSRSAGHNGVQSIIDRLKTKNFKRLRIGVNSSRPSRMSGKDYVLGRFQEDELAVISKIIAELPL